MNIIYTDFKYKDAVVDFIKLLVEDSYPDYSFKCFRHADFSVPYDFNMVKYSCLITHNATHQATYLANLYNSGSYSPIPCYQSVLNYAHPIIKLRLLYIDMYLVEHKMQTTDLPKHEKLYMSKMISAYEELLNYEKQPVWIGTFRDEMYEKNKINLKSKEDTSISTLFV